MVMIIVPVFLNCIQVELAFNVNTNFSSGFKMDFSKQGDFLEVNAI